MLTLKYGVVTLVFVTGKELLEELENYPSHTILNTGKPTTKRGGAIDLALATNSVTISH